MRRVAVVFGCVFLIASAIDVAGAGSPVTTKQALDLQLSGTIDIGGIYRNQTFHDLFYGPKHKASPQQVSRADGLIAEGRRVVPSLVEETGSLFVIDPQLSLALQATMQENVVAVVELATPYYVLGDEGGSSPFRTKDPFGSSLYSGNNVEYQRFLEVEQVYAEFRNFIAQDSGLHLRVGITDYALDFRGNGHPFLIDIQNCENPFLSATGSQQYLIINGQTGNPRWDAVGDGLDRRVDPGPYNRDSQDAAGVLVRYATDGGIVALDAYAFDIFESYEQNRDDVVIGSTLSFYFDEKRRHGKIAPTALLLLNDAKSVMATTGLGFQYFPAENQMFELYAEGYAQFGHYAQDVDVEAGVGAPAKDFDTITQQGAYAFYVGARLQAPPQDPAARQQGTPPDFMESWQPFIDLSYWEVSGDKNADDTKNTSFVTLENNNLSLIVESSYWGLDIDTNYRAIRAQAGFYPFHLVQAALMYANFHYENNNGTADNHDGNQRSKIGDEVDLTLTWEYSTHVKFRIGTGFLWDARALGTTHGLNLTMAQVIVDF